MTRNFYKLGFTLRWTRIAFDCSRPIWNFKMALDRWLYLPLATSADKSLAWFRLDASLLEFEELGPFPRTGVKLDLLRLCRVFTFSSAFPRSKSTASVIVGRLWASLWTQYSASLRTRNTSSRGPFTCPSSSSFKSRPSLKYFHACAHDPMQNNAI